MAKLPVCSFRRPWFNPLEPHNDSQMFVILVPGDPTPSAEPQGYTDIHVGKIFRYTNNKIKEFKSNVKM